MASRSLLLRTLGSKRLPVRNRRPVVEVAGRGLSSVPSNSTTEGDGSKSNSNSGGNSGGNSGSTGGEVAPVVHHQAFIKTRLSAGEWDPDFTDPLYRPKFKSSARIIAADDFAARPTVGFSGEFNSFQDAMVTLSWLDQKDHSHIYKLYLDMMLSAESSNSSNGAPTSHEYVMRVIAQQYNITAERVAAVVQLQHNEEQIILHDPGRKLLTETANRMDTLIKKEISDAYEHYKTNQPDSFTEDPVGVNGLPDRKKWKIAADVLDVELMARNATVRDDQRARLLIDGHVYVEDVDEDTIPVPMDADCQRLMKRQQRMKAAAAKQRTENLQSQPPSPSDSVRHHHHEQQQATAREPEWRTTNGDGKTRERWKFIAQTVNVRQLKKARRKHRSFINNSAANTIVEHNGSLRNSTMADLKTVSWKLTRHVQEHIYAGAKKGWLDRVNRNASKTWGKAPAAQSLPINTTLSSSPTTAEDEASFAPVLKANNTPNDPAGAPTEATNAAETETASEKDGISTETDSTTNESS